MFLFFGYISWDTDLKETYIIKYVDNGELKTLHFNAVDNDVDDNDWRKDEFHVRFGYEMKLIRTDYYVRDFFYGYEWDEHYCYSVWTLYIPRPENVQWLNENGED